MIFGSVVLILVGKLRDNDVPGNVEPPTDATLRAPVATLLTPFSSVQSLVHRLGRGGGGT